MPDHRGTGVPRRGAAAIRHRGRRHRKRRDVDPVHDARQPVLEPGDLDPVRTDRPTVCPSVSRSSPAAISTRSRSDWPASSSSSNPGPATPPPPDERRSFPTQADTKRLCSSGRTGINGAGQSPPLSRRKRSTSAMRSPVPASSASRPVRRFFVGVLFEPRDVGGGVVVLGDELVDLALVRRGRDLEIGRRHPAATASRAARSARARPSVTARSARTSAPWPTATPTGRPVRRNASCSTPTMPVGPSYDDWCSPSRPTRAPDPASCRPR